MRLAVVLRVLPLLSLLAGCASKADETAASIPDATALPEGATPAASSPSDGGADATDITDASPTERDPVLFVHGIRSAGNDFDVMMQRLSALGWPADRLFAKTFPDPAWGCNVDNAKLVADWAEAILKSTGAARLDVVAHSMGGLSSRRYMKTLGGAARVGTYVTIASMHHGLKEPCLSPLPVCVWQELCEKGAYLAELDVAPTTPGPARWVSIYSVDDGTVPAASSKLIGAENIELGKIPHSGDGGLLESPLTIAEVARVLQYP